MDDELRRLRHELQARPEDEVVARRYQVALERAGEGWVVLQFLERKYVCEQSWRDIARESESDVARCKKCDRDVTLVGSAQSAVVALREGRCVAVEEWQTASCLRSMAQDGSFHFAKAADRPCLVVHRLEMDPEAVSRFADLVLDQARRQRATELRFVTAHGSSQVALRVAGEWVELKPPPPPSVARAVLGVLEGRGLAVEIHGPGTGHVRLGSAGSVDEPPPVR